MDGVTILNVSQTYTTIGALYMTFVMAAAIISFYVFLIAFDDNILVSGIFAGIVVLMIFVGFRIPKDEIVYEVTVNRDVLWQDFTDRYKIIKQRGDIITVTEKEQKNETD